MLGPEVLAQLETPCLVIEKEIVRRNLEKMQKIADHAGVALRPHCKTHKMCSYAKLQLEYGACGITCAKVSMSSATASMRVSTAASTIFLSPIPWWGSSVCAGPWRWHAGAAA